MSTQHVTHNRLKRQLMALGPYLREEHCREGVYFFDCLACCISAKKAPENREFWGWWLTLEETESGLTYHYQLGQHNEANEWIASDIPKRHQLEVARTLREFYNKLHKLLDEHDIKIMPADSLSEDQIISAA